MTNSEFLNIKKLSERLKVSRRTIHYWLLSNNLPIPPIDGMKPPKWRASDVEAFLQRRDGEAE